MINTNKKGFTLIEVMLASALLVILGAAIAGLQYTLGVSQVTSINSFISVDEANSAVSQFTRELRTARKADTGSFPLESGNDNDITFYSDIDFDGKSEKVSYYLDGTDLIKSTIEPTGVPVTYPISSAKTKIISENIRNNGTPLFTYYNGDWPDDTTNNPLATPIDLLQAKIVKIYIRVNTQADSPTSDYVLESSAQIRMVKNNL
jgi:prepilin-type N-terminal cleavage/methylation domain-containing protein